MRLVKNKQTGKYYAAKILKKIEILKSKQIDHVQNESQILNVIHHPFIVVIGLDRFSCKALHKMHVICISSWIMYQEENCLVI